VAGPGWYYLGSKERVQVMSVLKERQLSRYRFDNLDSMSKTMELENRLAAELGAGYVLAVNSGTSALLCGLRALGIGRGDEVIVPGYTFIASIAAIIYSGASAVLAEIDDSLTLDVSDVRRKMSKRTKAIMPVHMIGSGADMTSIGEIANHQRCAVIEDTAQACGGRHRGRALGTIGDVGAFSMNVGKTITTGDGGFLATNDRGLYERAFAFHDHGFRPNRGGVSEDGPVMGLNLRMNELGAAIGVAQVDRMDKLLRRCRRNKSLVREVFSGLAGGEERPLHDLEGDCATAFVIIFGSSSRAARVAAALGGSPLAASAKHNYALMPQLQMLQDRVTDNGSTVAHGRPGDLPRTDNVLQRAVALSVGMVDRYLGTLGDITVIDDPGTVRRKAKRMRGIIDKVR